MLIIFLWPYADAFAQNEEERLYQEVLKATFIDEKSKITVELAKRGTPAAKQKLITLLSDSSSWNRAAAANGLVLFYDRDVSAALLEKMMMDHMIDAAVKKAFIRHAAGHATYLAEQYSTISDVKKRVWILEILAHARTPQADAFLKKIVDDPTSYDRDSAFRVIAERRSATDYSYIKQYCDTPLFKVHALAYLADKGTSADLPIFVRVLERQNDPACQIIAFKAVDMWGDEALKINTLINGLNSSEEQLKLGAATIIRGVKSDKVRKGLCRVARSARFQETRLAAAQRLLEYDSKDVIPSLVSILKERYTPRETTGMDIFLGYMSLGITSINNYHEQKNSKQSIEALQRRIGDHLKKITGVDFKTSYHDWYSWCMENGYTINGDNLIRHLFSGYQSKRKHAAESAMRLLGFASPAEFCSAHGSYTRDTDLALALAKMLIDKGYLVDDEE